MNSLKEKALPSLHGYKTEKLKEILEKKLEKNDDEQKAFHCEHELGGNKYLWCL